MTPSRRAHIEGYLAAADWMVSHEELVKAIAFLLSEIDTMQSTIDSGAQALDDITTEAARHIETLRMMGGLDRVCRCSACELRKGQ